MCALSSDDEIEAELGRFPECSVATLGSVKMKVSP
jgi:hypothetical protein